jgi:hypothetical protein
VLAAGHLPRPLGLGPTTFLSGCQRADRMSGKQTDVPPAKPESGLPFHGPLWLSANILTCRRPGGAITRIGP